MGDFWIALATIAAIAAAYFTFHIMRAGQHQVVISQQQFSQSVDAAQDAHLPVLIPVEPLLSLGERTPDGAGHWTQPLHNGYDRGLAYVRVALKNVGAGIALNVRGIVFESEPEYEVLKTTGQIHSFCYPLPLTASDEPVSRDWTGQAPSFTGDSEIGTTDRYKLYAPRKPTYEERSRGAVEKVARLTLTYSDIFRRKHAAIYDLTAQFEWENVAYLRNLTHDLGDMERAARSRMPVYQAPAVPRG